MFVREDLLNSIYKLDQERANKFSKYRFDEPRQEGDKSSREEL